MTSFRQTRRHFLQTAAFAGAAGLTGAFPGVSFSATGDTLTVRFDREMESLDPGLLRRRPPAPTTSTGAVMPAPWCTTATPSAGWIPSPHRRERRGEGRAEHRLYLEIGPHVERAASAKSPPRTWPIPTTAWRKANGRATTSPTTMSRSRTPTAARSCSTSRSRPS